MTVGIETVGGWLNSAARAVVTAAGTASTTASTPAAERIRQAACRAGGFRRLAMLGWGSRRLAGGRWIEVVVDRPAELGEEGGGRLPDHFTVVPEENGHHVVASRRVDDACVANEIQR